MFALFHAISKLFINSCFGAWVNVISTTEKLGFFVKAFPAEFANLRSLVRRHSYPAAIAVLTSSPLESFSHPSELVQLHSIPAFVRNAAICFGKL